MIDDVHELRTMSTESVWRNYQEAMDMMVLSSSARSVSGVRYYRAVSVISLEIWFELTEAELCQNY